MQNRDKKLFIGVDIGKTKIAVGLISSFGELLIRLEESTIDCNGNIIIKKCKEMIYEILTASPSVPEGIGVGASGVIDHSEKLIISSGAIPGWSNIRIGNILESEFKIKTEVDNDVNVAAVCEHTFGAGKGVNNSLYISIGTGVGTCYIENNIVHRGQHNLSGQIAYLKFFNSDFTVNELCGGRGIAARASGLNMHHTEEVFERARNGNPEAASIIADAVKGVAIISMWMQNIVDPNAIIIGGGVIAKNRDFFTSIKKSISELYFSNYQKVLGGKINIQQAVYGVDSGILGAACLCIDVS